MADPENSPRAGAEGTFQMQSNAPTHKNGRQDLEKGYARLQDTTRRRPATAVERASGSSRERTGGGARAALMPASAAAFALALAALFGMVCEFAPPQSARDATASTSPRPKSRVWIELFSTRC